MYSGDFYELSLMSKRCGIRLPDGVDVSTWSIYNDVRYKSDNIIVSVHKDDFWAPLAVFYEVSVTIRGILVYKDKWLHDVPTEMKNIVRRKFEDIEAIIKHYKDIKVKKSYNDMQKARKEQEKADAIRKHEEEKKRLLEMFKK